VKGEYEAKLQEAKGNLQLSQKDLVEAEDKLISYRSLVKRGFVTPEQLRVKASEVARQKFIVASNKAKLGVLENFEKERQETELKAKAKDAKLELARAHSSGQASIDKAESDLKAAEVTALLEKSTLDRIKTQLARCSVTAPQDGILVYSQDRPWDPAARIQIGAMVHFQQKLFSLPDLLKMEVKVKVHESVVKKIRVGLPAEIIVDAFANQVLHGTVHSVAPMANSDGWWRSGGVKEYVTIVKVDDLPAEAGLKPGFTAEVKIHVKEIPDVLLVPVQAVTELDGEHIAYVVKDNAIERRIVTVGENNEKFVQITSGLEEGEQVTLDARARGTAEAKAGESKQTDLKKTEPLPETPPASTKPAPAQPTAAKN
jgi:RND family efflux transporter MFP subunit